MWRNVYAVLVFAVFLVANVGSRADFVVQNGETVTTTQNLAAGESGVVESGGQIVVSGATERAIFGASGGNSVNNAGTISTLGAGVSVFNGANAVLLVGNNNTVINSGTVSTVGVASNGLFIDRNSVVTNSGTISTSGDSANGISVQDHNQVTNIGTITTTGDNSANGISVQDHNQVTNIGTITVSGTDSQGIRGSGDGNTIINSGVITANGTGGAGVVVGGSDNLLVNSGVIQATGTNGNAVLYSGAGNTLRLLPGSILEGPLNFAAGNTLDVANGLSIGMTFTGNAPSVIANGAPFAVSGLEVAVVDPTALAMAGDIAFDLTNAVSGSVFSRLRGDRLGGSSGQAVASLDRGDPDDPLSFAASIDIGTGAEAWAEVFGLARDQRAQSPAVGADYHLGGVIAGVDTLIDGDTRAGLFLGGSYGELDVTFGSQDEDISSAFLGAYGGYTSDSWAIDLVVIGGWSRYELNRNIANNAVPGGVETVSADYDGYFIAPELSVARTISVHGQKVVPSVQIGYAGTHLDGYTETGTANGLTVDDRFLHLLTGRFQVTVPVRIPPYADSVYVAPYAGVEGRTRLDDSDIDAVLLGQTIRFDAGGEDSVGAALAGIELSALLGDGVSLFGGAEATVESNSGRTIAGQAGLQIAF